MLKDEIWGCFKYIGIPMETVMNMPIHDRKYFIRKHNEAEANINNEKTGDKNVQTFEGSALNAYASVDQKIERRD